MRQGANDRGGSIKPWNDSVERARAPASLLERVEIWEALACRINASMRDWNEPDALAHECADPYFSVPQELSQIEHEHNRSIRRQRCTHDAPGLEALERFDDDFVLSYKAVDGEHQ